MSELTVTTTETGVDIVRPRGRLNMASAPRLTAAIADMVSNGRHRIVIDLSGVEFMDSSGLGALVSCLKKARQAGGDLRIAEPSAQVRTVLDLTNLSRVMRPNDSVERAAAEF